MSPEKPDSVEDQPLLVIVFDRKNQRYTVDSGAWTEHGFSGPIGSEREHYPGDRHSPQSPSHQSPTSPSQSPTPQSPSSQSPSSQSPSGNPPPNEDVMRCLRSLVAGHTTHCHWHVWTGSKWKDTMMENCGTC
jgi:hypothetical protein